MKRGFRHGVFLGIFALSAAAQATGSIRTKDLELSELLAIAWEGQWQQSGFPMVVRRWNQPVVAKLVGPFVSEQRDFVKAQLAEMSEATGVPAKLSEAQEDVANLEILIVREPVQALERGPCNTRLIADPSGIQKVSVTARVDVVKRCLLHELGHAFGMEGHPQGRSIMTYFSRPEGLSDADRWLLKLRYSQRLIHGMSPIKFVVEAAKLYESELIEESDRVQARKEADLFLANLFSSMSAYALGQGDVPKVLYRSGRTVLASIEQGRVGMKVHLALAYLNGDGVSRDTAKGLDWALRAAQLGNVQAQLLTATLFEGQRNFSQAHLWFRCAQAKGSGQAGANVVRVETILMPDSRAAIREASEAFAKTAACKIK